MSLVARCRHAFAPEVRRRGEAYARDGRVRIVERDVDEVSATVSGAEIYHVGLATFDRHGEVHVGCSCPFADDGCCKHIYALMVVLDRDFGGLHEPAGDGPLEVVLGSGGRRPRSRAASRLDAMRAHRPPPAPTWRQRLDEAGLTLERELRPRPRRVIELRLDLDATRARGALVIGFFERRPRPDGTLGAGKRARLRMSDASSLADPAAAEALRLLLALAEDATPSRGYGYRDPRHLDTSAVVLGAHGFAAVLPALCASRLLVVDGDEERTPLRWDGATRFRVAATVGPGERRGAVRVTARLERDGERIDASRLRMAHSAGLALVDDGRLVALDPEDRAVRLLIALRLDPAPLEAPASGVAELLDTLATALGPAAIEIDPALAIALEARRPAARVSLEPFDARRFAAAIELDHGDGWHRPGDEPRRRPRLQGGVLRVRDPAGDAALLDAIATAGVSSDGAPVPGRGEVAAAALPAVVGALLDAGVEVRVRGGAVRRGARAGLRVSSGIDWFAVDGEVAFDGVAGDLPEILRAVRAGERFVRLGDGSLGMLPEDWLARFGMLARIAGGTGGRGRGAGDDGAVRVTRTQAALLDAMLEHEDDVRVDATFAALRRRLHAHATVEPCDAPPGFEGALRPYQAHGVGWLRFLEELGVGGCLADDMGLGKTVQILAHLLGRRARRRAAGEPPRPSLVVVPKTLLFNWRAEAARFAPGLAVVVHHGADRARDAAALAAAELVVTTYATLVRDVGLFRALALDYAILDEAQAIKNATSQSARACCLLRAEHRLALTGTPIENRLSDLGSIFEFLNPGMIDVAAVLAPLAGPGGEDAGGLELLTRALRPFLLRRTKEEVLPELPPKVEQTVVCELDGKQRSLYVELRDHYRAELRSRIDRDGMGRAKIHVLEALLRLRQVACHPALIDASHEKVASAKLEVLLEHLEEVVAGGHKALVFSQFTSFLALVRARLERAGIAYAYLDGKTRDRAAPVERFQTDPACPVFLISLKAGGHGLNLTAADYVFLLDPWWNPAVEAQAIDRAHRIGQERRVFTYRLVAQDTVEQKVLELQAKKRGLAEAVIRSDANLLGQLTARDLDALFEA